MPKQTEVPGPLDEVNDDKKAKEVPGPLKSKQDDNFVQVKKEDYERLMSQLERNAKDIDLLYKASDKSRLAKAMGDGGEVLVKQVRVWTWKDTGLFVTSTKLISNRSEIVQGRWIEDQTVKVILEDGSELEVPYLEFSRNILKKETADIISKTESVDSDKRPVVIFNVQFPNGKTLSINSAFVN